MTPRFLACNTGWLMLPFNYSRSTGRGPRRENIVKFSLEHAEVLRRQLGLELRKEMDQRDLFGSHLPIE